VLCDPMDFGLPTLLNIFRFCIIWAGRRLGVLHQAVN
jgi:hypothetical protein